MTGPEFLVPATNGRLRRNPRSAFDFPAIFMRFQWKSAMCLYQPATGENAKIQVKDSLRPKAVCHIAIWICHLLSFS